MGSIIQTNLPAFVEQPERRVITSAPGQFDQMTCIYIGPASKVDVTGGAATANFLPKRGAPHLQYPMMFCILAQVTDMQGSLAEITANYTGRLNTNGQSTFTSEALIDLQETEGELQYNAQPFNFISYQQTVGTINPDGSTSEAVSTYYTVGVPRKVLHYWIQGATYKYVCRPQPTGPAFTGALAKILRSFPRNAGVSGYQVVLGDPSSGPNNVMAGLQISYAPFGFSSGPQNVSFDFRQVVDQWYDCTETWQIQFQIP